MQITKTSDFTGKVNTQELPITQAEYDAWRNAGNDDSKRFVQNAFPQLSADEREFLLTGITAAEWDEFMPPEPNEDEDGPQ